MGVKDCKKNEGDNCIFPRNQYRGPERNLPYRTKEMAVKYFKKFWVYNNFLPGGKKLMIQNVDSKKSVSS